MVIIHYIDNFPFEDNSAEIVIADLCLHYFSKEVTEKIIKEIQRVLVPNGYLIFRVNSVNDVNINLQQGEIVEEHFYFINNITKRFFNEEDIKNFFKKWEITYLNEEKL